MIDAKPLFSEHCYICDDLDRRINIAFENYNEVADNWVDFDDKHISGLKKIADALKETRRVHRIRCAIYARRNDA